MIIGTTSCASELKDLGVVNAFDKVIHVPKLSKEEILTVLGNYECEQSEKEKIADLVQNSPIKQLLFLIDRALQKSPKLLYENFASEHKDYESKYK